MAKTNIRSIRFSDEIKDAIESQPGENFSTKFESMVTRCLWELPAAEERLRELDQQIANRREELWRLTQLTRQLSGKLDGISDMIEEIIGESELLM